MFAAPTALPDDPAALQLLLHAALAEIERLRLLIAGLERNRFGRRSERLDDAAFQQGTENLEQSLAEQVARLDAASSAARVSSEPKCICLLATGRWKRFPRPHVASQCVT